MVVSLHRPSILSISPFPFIFVIPLFILHLVSCPPLSPRPCLSFSDSAIVFYSFFMYKSPYVPSQITSYRHVMIPPSTGYRHVMIPLSCYDYNLVLPLRPRPSDHIY